MDYFYSCSFFSLFDLTHDSGEKNDLKKNMKKLEKHYRNLIDQDVRPYL